MASDKPQRAKSTMEREVPTKRRIRQDWLRLIVLVSHHRTDQPTDRPKYRPTDRPILTTLLLWHSHEPPTRTRMVVLMTILVQGTAQTTRRGLLVQGTAQTTRRGLHAPSVLKLENPVMRMGIDFWPTKGAKRLVLTEGSLPPIRPLPLSL